MPDDTESFDTTSILDLCPAEHAAIYGLWSAKRRPRALPAWSAFSPVELRPWLDFSGLIEVLPDALPDGDDFRYVRIGAGIIREFGHDLTGGRISENTLTQNNQNSLNNLRRIVVNRRPRYRNSSLFCVNTKTYMIERLFLPLGEDGARVDRILFYGRPILQAAGAKASAEDLGVN